MATFTLTGDLSAQVAAGTRISVLKVRTVSASSGIALPLADTTANVSYDVEDRIAIPDSGVFSTPLPAGASPAGYGFVITAPQLDTQWYIPEQAASATVDLADFPAAAPGGVDASAAASAVAAAASAVAAAASASGLTLNASTYGFAAANSAASNTTALNAATAAALAAMGTLGVRSVTIAMGRGTFQLNPVDIPGGVSLVGQDRDSTILVNNNTAGNNVFIHFAGSNSRMANATIKGQRALQAAPGLAAVQFSRPNNLSRAGGVTLTSSVSAGATSIVVNTASPGGEPIRAGEVITLRESTTVEQVRVANSYASGTTIALESATLNAFTTSANASVAVSDVGIHDCTVYSNGRDGIAFWHTQGGYADRNIVRDFEDTAIDVPSAGSRYVMIRDNHIEGKGRWGIAFDTAETEFGRVSYCQSRGNVIKFLPGGGGFVSGGATDGIYFGVTEGCSSIDDTVDMTHAGLSGMRLAGSGSLFAENVQIVNPTILGPTTPRASTFGVRSTMGALDCLLSVKGGNISGVDKCIEPDMIRQTRVIGVRMHHFASYGVNLTSDGTGAQLAVVSDCDIQGGVVAIRFGGTTAHASNAVRTIGNMNRGQSFAPIIVDAGWNHTASLNIP